MIAGGYMTDGNNPALDYATTISIDEIEEALLSDTKKAPASKKVKDPGVGSYERFMSAFGGKVRGPVPGEGADGGFFRTSAPSGGEE